MTGKVQKKEEVRGGVNPVMAAVTGLVVGAGAAVAGAIAFNDKKNRDKVAKVLSDTNDKAQEKMDEAEDKMKEVLK